MGKVYVNQTKLKIELLVSADITNTTCTIKFIKPDKTEGYFDATIDDATTGLISYTISDATDIDQAGRWTFWAYVIYADLKVIAGESSLVEIYEQGK